MDAWSADAIEIIETEYFNLGSEWIVYTLPDDAENITPDNVNEYDDMPCGIYAHEWKEEKIKNEIVNALGAAADDKIVMWYWQEWRRVPVYREA